MRRCRSPGASWRLLLLALTLSAPARAAEEFGFAPPLPVAYADPLTELAAWATSRPVPDEPPEISRGYRFIGPALAEVAQAVADRPGVVRVEAFGRSATDEPLWAFHVTDPATPVEEEVLVFAGIHALEWISSEVALTLLHELIARPPRGTRVTVIPLLNPDGRARVEADLIAGITDRYHRSNGAMVDLNRDYRHEREARAVWRAIIPGYYSTSPEPLSQPESAGLDALLSRHDYARAASLHAFGGYLYHPYAGAWRRPERWRDYVRAGRAMEKAMGANAYRTRQLARWGFFFRAHGTEVDHLHAEHGIDAWLIELTRTGLRPLRLGRDRKTPFRWYNPVDPSPHIARATPALRELVRGSMHPAGTTGPRASSTAEPR